MLGPTILAANGSIMPMMVQGQLQLSDTLSSDAKKVFVLKDLCTGTLVSLGQHCDNDCNALFTKYNVNIIKNNQVIIMGQHKHNGLWSVPITPPSVQQANGILQLDKTKQELAEFHYTSLSCPMPSMLLRAICKGHLITFPGLTTLLITKHLPKSLTSTFGHQDQEA